MSRRGQVLLRPLTNTKILSLCRQSHRVAAALELLARLRLVLAGHRLHRREIKHREQIMSRREAFLAAQNAGKAFLEEHNWAVIGDVLNSAKPAHTVCTSLTGAGKTVHKINPRDKTGECFAGLENVGLAIDVVDLCINHIEGLKQMQQAAAIGISKVWIQPGAESPEILAFCQEKGIEVFQGCVMIELGVNH